MEYLANGVAFHRAGKTSYFLKPLEIRSAKGLDLYLHRHNNLLNKTMKGSTERKNRI